MVQIWHNAKCSKSRASLELIEKSKHDMDIYKYLDESPSIYDIKDVLIKLDMSAKELMRTSEDIYKVLKVQDISDEDKLLDILVTYPKLIQRPIIIRGDKAVIGRPIENTIELLK